MKISENMSKHLFENGLKEQTTNKDNDLYTKLKFIRNREIIKNLNAKK